MLLILKIKEIFLSEISLRPQIVDCPVIVTITKVPQVFVVSLSKSVAINLEMMEKLTVRKFYVIYRNSKQAFS